LITASVYLSAARSAITLGFIETCALNGSPVSKTLDERTKNFTTASGSQTSCYATAELSLSHYEKTPT